MGTFAQRSSIYRKLMGLLVFTIVLFIVEFSTTYVFSKKFLRGFLEAYQTENYLNRLNLIKDSVSDGTKRINALLLPNANLDVIRQTYTLRREKMDIEVASLSEAFKNDDALKQEFSIFMKARDNRWETINAIFALVSHPSSHGVKKSDLTAKLNLSEEYRIEISESLDRLSIALRLKLNHSFEYLHEIRNHPLYAGFLFTLFSTVILLIISLNLIRQITLSLGNLEKVSEQVGSGNLRIKADILYPDEIGKLTHNFNHMIENLQKVTVSKELLESKNRELEQFAYIASHDLQEPLRMVASYVDLLRQRYQGKLDKDADEFIDYAVDGARRMKQLISDLLEYSRIGTKKKEFQWVGCENVLTNALKNLKVSLEECQAIVTHDPLPQVWGDEVQLLSLFQNLIGNAVKFRGDKTPQIHISAKENDMHWVFSFKDQGIGIDPKFFERIFIIFQRLHGHSQYAGTGIGLAVCKKIVERHGGKIWVESQPDSGSTFFFTIDNTHKPAS